MRGLDSVVGFGGVGGSVVVLKMSKDATNEAWHRYELSILTTNVTRSY